MAELYLIRHAQASFGTADYDRLSPLGCRQAEVLGEYFRDCAIHFDAVYSGELERQRKTAKIVLGLQLDNVHCETDPRLNEVTVRSCRYFGPEVAAARRSVRPVPDRACGSASVRANRVAMRFQCPTPFLTLAITPLRSASIAIWQVLRTAPYRYDRTVT